MSFALKCNMIRDISTSFVLVGYAFFEQNLVLNVHNDSDAHKSCAVRHMRDFSNVFF